MPSFLRASVVLILSLLAALSVPSAGQSFCENELYNLQNMFANAIATNGRSCSTEFVPRFAANATVRSPIFTEGKGAQAAMNACQSVVLEPRYQKYCVETFTFRYVSVTLAENPDDSAPWCAGTGVFTIGLNNLFNASKSCLFSYTEVDTLAMQAVKPHLYTYMTTFYDSATFTTDFVNCAEEICLSPQK